jgi:hypothetical protein
MKYADARRQAEQAARRSALRTVVYVSNAGEWAWTTYSNYLHGVIHPFALAWDSHSSNEENAALLQTATAYMEQTYGA